MLTGEEYLRALQDALQSPSAFLHENTFDTGAPIRTDLSSTKQIMVFIGYERELVKELFVFAVDWTNRRKDFQEMLIFLEDPK